MEIEEFSYGNRIKLSHKIIGQLTVNDVIFYFNRLQEKNIFSNEFGYKSIKFMQFNSEKSISQLKDVLEKINIGDNEIFGGSRIRGICYNICKLYGYKYSRIMVHGTKLIGCDEYSPDGKSCGCDYAPNKFWHYHCYNNYEDTIAYSKIPWTYKIGVKISR